MADRDLNKQFEAIKRQGSDLVREMHARKLAIPAGALLVALIAALVLLPQGSTPPAAPPTATAPVEAPKVARVAQVSLIEPSTIDEDIPLTSTTDPFTGESGYTCSKVSSDPKIYRCVVSDIAVYVLCNEEGGTGPCAEDEGKAAGASGAAGSDTGAGGAPGETTMPGETMPPDSGDGGDSGGTDEPDATTVSYTVTVTIDGETKKDVVAGTELPKSSGALVVYAGPNDANSKAIFLLSDGVTAEGVAVDDTFGSFALAKNQTVTLTDAKGVEHKMTLKSITKVTK